MAPARRPKSNVFVIHCSLQSLSHISDSVGRAGREVHPWIGASFQPSFEDTLGPLGRVIGVCSRDPQKRHGRKMHLCDCDKSQHSATRGYLAH